MGLSRLWPFFNSSLFTLYSFPVLPEILKFTAMQFAVAAGCRSASSRTVSQPCAANPAAYAFLPSRCAPTPAATNSPPAPAPKPLFSCQRAVF